MLQMKSLTDVSSQSHLFLFQENKGNQEFCQTLRDLDPNAFLFCRTEATLPC